VNACPSPASTGTGNGIRPENDPVGDPAEPAGVLGCGEFPGAEAERGQFGGFGRTEGLFGEHPLQCMSRTGPPDQAVDDFQPGPGEQFAHEFDGGQLNLPAHRLDRQTGGHRVGSTPCVEPLDRSFHCGRPRPFVDALPAGPPTGFG
jgi:hypothetical protein